MFRSRVKPIVFNLLLFGLGVTVCFTVIQMNNNEIDSPVVYTNSQAYQAALSAQQLQTQQEPPCETTAYNKHINEIIVDNNFPNDEDNTRRDITEGKTLPHDYNEVKVGESSFVKTSPDYKKILSRVVKSSEPVRNNKNDIYKDKLLEGGQTTPKEPTVFIVTPTFYRPEQKPELTRVAQALLPVRHFIHWILIDDVTHGSDESVKDLENFMKRFPLLYYTILKSFPPKLDTKIVGKPRGVGGRTAAIHWLRKHAVDKQGVVYFADDDNTYDSDIFRQMQHTKKVTMWPVGLVTELGVSSPIVKNGRVVGFYDGWNGLRKFPVDMAGFAINMQLFRDKPLANMPYVAGYEEDELLRSLGITIHDIQPLANNCTEILVWHTKAIKNVWPKRPKNLKPSIAANTNLNQLLNSLPQKIYSGPGTSQLKSDSGFSLYNLIFGGP